MACFNGPLERKYFTPVLLIKAFLLSIFNVSFQLQKLFPKIYVFSKWTYPGTFLFEMCIVTTIICNLLLPSAQSSSLKLLLLLFTIYIMSAIKNHNYYIYYHYSHNHYYFKIHYRPLFKSLPPPQPTSSNSSLISNVTLYDKSWH